MIIKRFLKHSLRSGALFKKYFSESKEREHCTVEEILSFQKEKLAATIRLAQTSVQFYKNICVGESIGDIPIIDKHIVRSRFNEFKSRNFKGRSFEAMTSGSTGTPGVFLRDLDAINFEQAVLWRQWESLGKKPGSRRAVLRGDIICSPERKKPPFWHADPFSRELSLSSFHLSEENIPLYVDRIRKYAPFDLQAYPSTALLLADYCLRKGIPLQFGAVFTSSEQLFDAQRETIEKGFSCKVFDWYGQAERVAAIGMCEKGVYHVIEDYSYVEFLPAHDGLHEIVGTTFNNDVMPLLRYRTGDLVELGSLDCGCGRPFRTVKRIHGRETSFLKTPDGRRISVLNHIARGVPHLVELQFVQNRLDEIVLRVVVTDEFSKQDETILIKHAKERISNDMRYAIERVSRIERSKNGKFIPVLVALT